MGHAIIAAIEEHPKLTMGAALHGGASLDDLEGCSVAIDFTTPNASLKHARKTVDLGIPIVIGTTGFDDTQRAVIVECAVTIPVILSSNMSIGVNLLAALVEKAAAQLGPDYDIEICEMHHRRKVDAPSGTALMFGEAAAMGRGSTLTELRADQSRDGARKSGEIGFASLRGGDVAGDHTVYFAGEGERLELTHRASTRAVFAQGALRAAEWIIGKPPGLYSMRDVLGID